MFVFAGISAIYAEPPVWSTDGCGVSKYEDAGEMELPSGRIVGGQDAQPYEFPWQVSIRRRVTDRHFCGGLIINSQWVLTASHCVDGQVAGLLSVVAGEWDSTDTASTVRQTLDVTQIIMHDGYNANTLENDIALIQVTGSFQLSQDVFPVCAPDPLNLYEYVKCQCSGWGTLVSGGTCCPAILQYVSMNITTNAFCQAAYTDDPVTGDMICATDNTGSNDRDACQGDSGGPLTIKEADGTFRVVGIVSWGIGCASGYPGVYSRVGYFTDWISTNIGSA
jgi:secreted trypsin-like serine protease